MSKHNTNSTKKTTAQSLIELTNTSTDQDQRSSVNPVTTIIHSNPTSQQDSLTAEWPTNMIEQIKEEIRQQTTLLRRKLTNLHQELRDHPVRTESIVKQYYGLKALIKNHVQTIESEEKSTGQKIDGFWNPDYQREWSELETLFKSLSVNTTDADNTTVPFSEQPTQKIPDVQPEIEDNFEDASDKGFKVKESINFMMFFPMLLQAVPNFSGDLLEFESFWRMFTLCVDNTSLSPDYKKAVLLTKLIGEPKNIARSKKNYDEIKSALLQRYRDPVQTRERYLAMLRQFQPIKNEKNLVELKKLIQTIETVMMGLDAHLSDETTLRAINSLVLDRLPPIIYNKVELTKYAPRKDIEEIIRRIRQQIYLNEQLYPRT